MFFIFSISYFLSKHAVVNITRQFGSSKSVYKTGIKVCTMYNAQCKTLNNLVSLSTFVSPARCLVSLVCGDCHSG